MVVYGRRCQICKEEVNLTPEQLEKWGGICPKCLKGREEKFVGEMPIIASDTQLTSKMIQMCRYIAKQHDLPITGLTVLGGRPYVNTTGLDYKLRKDPRQLLQVGYEVIKRATPKDLRAGYIGYVRMFDKLGFQEALRHLSGEVSVEVLERLKEVFTHTYTDEGWASDQSVKMSTLKNPDFINMMALRRATNRAKRQAVGLGLLTTEESPEVKVEYEVVQPEEEKKKPPKGGGQGRLL